MCILRYIPTRLLVIQINYLCERDHNPRFGCFTRSKVSSRETRHSRANAFDGQGLYTAVARNHGTLESVSKGDMISPERKLKEEGGVGSRLLVAR